MERPTREEMLKFEDMVRYAGERRFTLYRGNARNGRSGKPTGFILYSPRGLWSFYRTLKEVQARIDTGR